MIILSYWIFIKNLGGLCYTGGFRHTRDFCRIGTFCRIGDFFHIQHDDYSMNVQGIYISMIYVF